MTPQHAEILAQELRDLADTLLERSPLTIASRLREIAHSIELELDDATERAEGLLYHHHNGRNQP